MLPAMRRVAGSTYMFQQDSTPARARDTVQLLQQDTAVHRTRPMAAKQPKREPG